MAIVPYRSKQFHFHFLSLFLLDARHFPNGLCYTHIFLASSFRHPPLINGTDRLEWLRVLWARDDLGSSPFNIFLCFFFLLLGFSLSSGRGCLRGIARPSRMTDAGCYGYPQGVVFCYFSDWTGLRDGTT